MWTRTLSPVNTVSLVVNITAKYCTAPVHGATMGFLQRRYILAFSVQIYSFVRFDELKIQDKRALNVNYTPLADKPSV